MANSQRRRQVAETSDNDPKGWEIMSARVRRLLSLIEEIEAFRWRGSPDMDPDGIYYCTQHLLDLAVRFKFALGPQLLPEAQYVVATFDLSNDTGDFSK